MHVESEQMLRFAAMMRRGSQLELGLKTEDCICGSYRTGRMPDTGALRLSSRASDHFCKIHLDTGQLLTANL
jgi:hypothetical protein